MTDETNQSGFREGLQFGKDLIFLLPILGSALAIIYDVGFFSGIDISFFTLFSLNEHIGFALQVLPGALLLAALLVILISFELKKPADERIAALPSTRRRILQGTGVIVILVVLVGAYFFSGWLGLVTVVIGLVAAPLIKSIIRINPNPRIFLAALLAGLLTFGAGYHSAISHLQNEIISTTIERKSDGAIQGKIIRSGDRGVLLYEQEKKRVMLLRWDEIKQISKTR